MAEVLANVGVLHGLPRSVTSHPSKEQSIFQVIFIEIVYISTYEFITTMVLHRRIPCIINTPGPC